MMTAKILWPAAFVPLVLAGCSQSTSANNTPPTRIEQAPDPSVVQVRDAAQFPLVQAELRRRPQQLSVNGVAAPDVERTVHVNSLAGGRVMEIRARLGDDVQRGQTLLRIHSADLAQAIADYQKARADQLLAGKALTRAQTLYSHGALAGKDVELAEDAAQKAQVDVDAAAQRIRLLGGNLDELSPVIDVKSPITGTIVEQNTVGGEGVKSLDNSPSLFTVADLSRVWMLCDVYENDLAQVRQGDSAEIHLNAYPDMVLRGRVGNIARILDAATRTAKVRIELDNRQARIRPGMFGTAVFISQDKVERVAVAQPAIIRLHDRDWVFRSEGGNRFRLTEVQTGPTDPDGKQEILSGLRPQEMVAADALRLSAATANEDSR